MRKQMMEFVTRLVLFYCLNFDMPLYVNGHLGRVLMTDDGEYCHQTDGSIDQTRIDIESVAAISIGEDDIAIQL